MKKNLIAWIMFVLSLVGFIDAAYLAIKVLAGAPIVCYAFSGCDAVIQSMYGKLFGVPLSVLGALFYAVMIVLITDYLQRKTRRALMRVVYAAAFGGLFSLYLFTLQAFVINAWCFYCVISGAVGFLNALLAVCFLRRAFNSVGDSMD